MFNAVVEQLQELVKRSVVHPIDVGHFCDTEVEHGTTACNRSVLFTLFVNFNSLQLGSLEILCNFL